jgi:hypothetical protein
MQHLFLGFKASRSREFDLLVEAVLQVGVDTPAVPGLWDCPVRSSRVLGSGPFDQNSLLHLTLV